MFEEIAIEIKEESREVIAQWMPGSGAEDYVVSANIQAIKPLNAVAAPRQLLNASVGCCPPANAGCCPPAAADECCPPAPPAEEEEETPAEEAPAEAQAGC